MKKRRTVRAWLIAALLCVAPLLPVGSSADERILDYESDIRVQPNGELLVTETVRVRAEGRDIRRGIYRDFPTRYRDRWGNRVTVDFVPVSVRRNGGAEPWHAEARGNGVRVYFGSASRVLEPGEHEYVFTFATNRQLGFFDQHDELYFNAVGHGWSFPIDHAAVRVTLPFTVAAEDLQVDVYTGRQGARESDATARVVNGNQVQVETTAPLPPRHGLTVAVAWPKGRVAPPGAGQRLRWFLADNAAALVLLLGLLAPLAWYLWAWNRVGRDPRKGVVIPRFEPPRGLSPAACRYVRDMRFGRHAFTAAIVSLAVKGQVVIEEDDAEFTLRRTAAAPLQPLTPGEQGLLGALLPAAGDSIVMDNEHHATFRAASSALQEALKKEYRGRLFHLNGLYLLPPIAMTLAAAAIAAFFPGGPPAWIAYLVLSVALHGLFLVLMRAPTPAGRAVMDQIEGFRRYLDTAEQQRLDAMRSPTLTPEVFEAFLPYAYALGVENTWCERFEREMPREPGETAAWRPAWYRGSFHGGTALSHLGGGFGKSFSGAIASASTPPGSSSGSGGGGFSGGGGGGGGGGGW